ncbi:MAG TPA: hypothetical protein DHV85_10370 [Candidatus Accumulibacter sp.]|nr:hypothetical protein [Accumulibacter sp.]
MALGERGIGTFHAAAERRVQWANQLARGRSAETIANALSVVREIGKPLAGSIVERDAPERR